MPRTSPEKWAPEGLQQVAQEVGAIINLDHDLPLLERAGIRQEDILPLVRQGWLEKLDRRGLYRIREIPRAVSVDALAAVGALLEGKPHYVSWWAALSHHDLTEQVPVTVRVAVQSQHRHGAVAGARLIFVRVSPKKFFGYRTIRVPGGTVGMALPEKAIIDSLDHPDYAGGFGEVAKAIGQVSVPTANLVAIANRYGVRSVAGRLGWLIESLRHEDASELLRMVNRGAPYLLNPSGPTAGEIDRRWNLVVNTSAEALTAWRHS